MKQLAKIFIILGMVVGFWAIIPLIVGIPALKRLDTSRTREELGSYPILVLLFVNIVAGIVMFIMKDEDLLN
jgi:hypothetical protein